MSKKIINVIVSPANRQEGKGEYIPRAQRGNPIYAYDRSIDETGLNDGEVWSEATMTMEGYFISFFTDQWAWGKARNDYRARGVQTRIPKEEWSAEITSIKGKAVRDWANNQPSQGGVGGISFSGEPNIEGLKEGKYEFNIVLYANQYDKKLRMIFTVEIIIGKVIKIPPKEKLKYTDLLSIVIKQTGDKFPFSASHKRIAELLDQGIVEKFTDEETGQIRWRLYEK